MKKLKKHTQKQKIAQLDKQVSQTFGLMIQLSQEVQHLGGMFQTMLEVMKEMPGYDAAVETAQKNAESALESTKQESVQEETPVLEYGDEQEKRMDIIGQNGNTGEHYEQS